MKNSKIKTFFKILITNIGTMNTMIKRYQDPNQRTLLPLADPPEPPSTLQLPPTIKSSYNLQPNASMISPFLSEVAKSNLQTSTQSQNEESTNPSQVISPPNPALSAKQLTTLPSHLSSQDIFPSVRMSFYHGVISKKEENSSLIQYAIKS